MDATLEPQANDNDIYLYYQPNLQEPSFLYPDPAYWFASVAYVSPTGLASR